MGDMFVDAQPKSHLTSLSVYFLQNIGTGPLKLDYKTLAALPTTSLQKVNRVSVSDLKPEGSHTINE